MFLGRLRIRGRLALLLMVPLVVTFILGGGYLFELVSKASRANDTADAVRTARVASALIRALQEERLLSAGRLIGETSQRELIEVQADTDEAAARVAAAGLPDVNRAVPGVSLAGLRSAVAGAGLAPAQVVATYSALITVVIESLNLLDAVDADTAQGRQVVALDGVLRANEGLAGILAAMAAPDSPNMMPVFVSALSSIAPAGLRFANYSSPEQLVLYRTAIGSINGRLGANFAESLLQSPGSAMSAMQDPPPFADLKRLTGVGRLVESQVLVDALAAAEDSAFANNRRAIGFVVIALLEVMVAILLGGVIGRSVVIPVLRLTRSAERVANLTEAELVRVADDDSPESAPPRLEPIEVVGRDELADFARAFGRVQETAARLVERQVASRRNVAVMFRHVGRRTQNLVGRQISLIDKLEREETDPQRLRELYRLDHMSSRLRRSASSLVVLSGATTSDEHVAPLAIDDVARLGLAEIEDYTRVDVDVTTPVRIAPALINDLMLLLAELMENATGFSPPGTRVVVTGISTSDGVRIAVVDHGLGMSPDQLTEENSRLTRRERLDLAPTEVLGLFVVGRLARRHGLRVVLTATPGGGVTASIDVPTRLLSDPVVAPAVALMPRGGPRSGEGTPAFAGDPAAIDRAARTMRELLPWNAFDTGGPATATRPTPAVHPPDVHAIGTWPAQPAAPGIPHQRPATSPADASTPGQPLSAMNRRVPGATLRSLQGDGPARSVPMAPSSADDARDSLAQFESGVARAMRDLDRDEGRQ